MRERRAMQETLAFLAYTTRLVERTSDREVRIAVPYVSGYDITSVDNVSVTLPRAAVRTNMTTTGTPIVIGLRRQLCGAERSRAAAWSARRSIAASVFDVSRRSRPISADLACM